MEARTDSSKSKDDSLTSTLASALAIGLGILIAIVALHDVYSLSKKLTGPNVGCLAISFGLIFHRLLKMVKNLKLSSEGVTLELRKEVDETRRAVERTERAVERTEKAITSISLPSHQGKPRTSIRKNEEFWGLVESQDWLLTFDIYAVNAHSFLEKIREKDLKILRLRLILTADDVVKSFYDHHPMSADASIAPGIILDGKAKAIDRLHSLKKRERVEITSFAEQASFPKEFFAIVNSRFMLSGRYIREQDTEPQSSVGFRSDSAVIQDLSLVNYYQKIFDEEWRVYLRTSEQKPS